MKTKIFLVIVAAITIFSGCKKGANDPFISLKCRKARVVGEWKATSVKFTNTFTSGSTTFTSSYSYANGTWTTTSSGSNNSGVGSYEVAFNKDGTYTMTTVTDDERTVVEGTWNFSGKIGDDKNKDHIILKTTSETTTDGSGVSVTTYDVNSFDGSYYLDELGSKQMVWKITSNSTDSYTPQGGTINSTSSTSDGEYIWELI